MRCWRWSCKYEQHRWGHDRVRAWFCGSRERNWKAGHRLQKALPASLDTSITGELLKGRHTGTCDAFGWNWWRQWKIIRMQIKIRRGTQLVISCHCNCQMTICRWVRCTQIGDWHKPWFLGINRKNALVLKLTEQGKTLIHLCFLLEAIAYKILLQIL